jgi:hypothetical protein
MKLLFYVAAAGDISDKTVAWATWGRYSHVELQFSDDMCFSASWRDGGTRFKQITIDPTHWDILDVPTTPEQEAVIRNFCAERIGVPYDWIGAVSVLLPINLQDPVKWYCSEICAAALRSCVMRFPEKLSPSRMYKLTVKQLSS